MPSIEFLGYSESEAAILEGTLRDDLSDLEFCDEIIFVVYRSVITGFSGSPQAYLRVCTRNEAKGMKLVGLLKRYADVEFIKSTDIAFRNG